ncbi:MAG TPA: alpha-amylase family glycosyl hydrolase [Labilithrix sp.]|nr:alpha-amylase family glycosyl hydrolase [Labilithrix sp.]
MRAHRFSPPALSFLGAAAVIALAAACSSADHARPRPDVDGPVSRAGRDGGPPGDTDGGVVSTGISFPADAAFAERPCTVTLRFADAATEVSVAGEFTDWAAAPRPMAKTNGAFELTIGPEARLTPGTLYAYKLVVDGTWRLDPAGTHRKLASDTMNSAFVLPACKDGPELTAGALAASATGDARVRVTVRRAADGVRPAKVVASLDRAPVAAGTFSLDPSAGAVDFSFSALSKGKHTLSLVAVDERERASLPVDLPFWIEDEPFSYRDGLLYMFMVDRFANGNPQNDAPVGLPVEYDADFHGGDIEGALAVLKSGYFEKLGVRTIWLSPLNRQTSKYEIGDGNQLFSGYHGYWPVRAREVEPRFGGDAALRAFIREAHARGLRVLLDLINNQVHEDHEYVAPHGDWFRSACKCGDDANGCGWSKRPFDCMFQLYLPDIDWTNGTAAQRFVDDAVFWIAEFDFDGFRVDAVKHVESNSIWNLRAELARRFEQGGARIFMVGETAVGEHDHGTFFGETFDDGYAWIDAYTGPFALDGQFDFPTRHNMADGLVDGRKPLSEVETELHKAESRYRVASQHVRFLNGHDNPRIASIAARDEKLGCTWASGCRGDALPPATYTEPVVFQRLRRALTVLYTLPGVPYLYAGDEVAFGGGPDPDMRRDMRFAETALATVQMHKPGAAVLPLSSEQVALLEFARKLGTTRTASRALRRGARVTLVGDDADLWVYGYEDGGDVAIIAVNRGGAVTSRLVPTNGLSLGGITSLISPLGTGSATLGGSGVTLSVPAGETAIFVGK